MENPCINFSDEVSKRLAALPSKWRDIITQVLTYFIVERQKLLCDDIKECQAVTSLSDFEIDGDKICITFTDEKGVEVRRCISLKDFLNRQLDELDPKCVATTTQWANYSFPERVQAIVDGVCTDCVELTSTTTTTTAPYCSEDIVFVLKIWKDANITYEGTVQVFVKDGAAMIYFVPMSDLSVGWNTKKLTLPCNYSSQFSGPFKVVSSNIISSLGTAKIEYYDNAGHHDTGSTNLTVTGYAPSNPYQITIYYLDPVNSVPSYGNPPVPSNEQMSTTTTTTVAPTTTTTTLAPTTTTTTLAPTTSTTTTTTVLAGVDEIVINYQLIEENGGDGTINITDPDAATTSITPPSSGYLTTNKFGTWTVTGTDNIGTATLHVVIYDVTAGTTLYDQTQLGGSLVPTFEAVMGNTYTVVVTVTAPVTTTTTTTTLAPSTTTTTTVVGGSTTTTTTLVGGSTTTTTTLVGDTTTTTTTLAPASTTTTTLAPATTTTTTVAPSTTTTTTMVPVACGPAATVSGVQWTEIAYFDLGLTSGDVTVDFVMSYTSGVTPASGGFSWFYANNPAVDYEITPAINTNQSFQLTYDAAQGPIIGIEYFVRQNSSQDMRFDITVHCPVPATTTTTTSTTTTTTVVDTSQDLYIEKSVTGDNVQVDVTNQTTSVTHTYYLASNTTLNSRLTNEFVDGYSYTIAVTVTPDGRANAPISILDSTGTLNSCAGCTTLTTTHVGDNGELSVIIGT